MKTAWVRLAWVVGVAVIVGCGEAEPIRYAHSEVLDGDAFAEKPNARRTVVETVDGLFGTGPTRIEVPEGAGLPEGGRYLAAYSKEAEDEAPRPVAYLPSGGDGPVAIEGGEALYTRNCLHCHGVSGDGAGPTAPFLYPRPRDYRYGLFKFTSTDYGRKPTREDLRRTINNGIHGTSMPAFSAQLTPQQIEQVIDYVIFLSMRGETESKLIQEAEFYAEEDFADEAVREEFAALAGDIAQGVFATWADAQEPANVFVPKTPRVPTSATSIARGRELFLGISKDVKLECAGCHGPQALGNGDSWIDPETFDRYVFTYDPTDPEPLQRLAEAAGETKKWSDEMGQPLRPANLNRGVYKGGRRPIDLYWRISTGITGTPMPAHAQTVTDPDDLWHLVNFVMALPYDESLLRADELRRLGVLPKRPAPAAAEARVETAARRAGPAAR